MGREVTTGFAYNSGPSQFTFYAHNRGQIILQFDGASTGDLSPNAVAPDPTQMHALTKTSTNPTLPPETSLVDRC
jgi:hypothetical protein